MERLRSLHDLVCKWNRRVNLIGRGTEMDLWRRHIADSAQLWFLPPFPVSRWADLGTGAGFPGLVLAALAAESQPDLTLILVESDQRKAVFLAEAARAMQVKVDIRSARIETIEPVAADVLTARALAPLDTLLGYAEKHLAPGGVGLFPKGATVHKEIEGAALRWRFKHRIHRSITEPSAAIVEVGGVKRV